MLGVGPLELLLIGVVALIVIGPKELPGLMHKVGQFAGTVRRMGQDFQRELNKTTGLNEIKNLRDSVTQPLKATADAIRKEFNTTTASGQVTPSGALKPADPKAESVVDEIKAAAGIGPFVAAGPAKTGAPAMTPMAPAAQTPVKAARPAKIKAPTESTVSTAEIEPVKPARKPAVAKAIESPAPVEAIAPAKAAGTSAAAVAAPVAADTDARKPVRTRRTKEVAAIEGAPKKPALRKRAVPKAST